MDIGRAQSWGLVVAGGAAAVYGFHRLCLWMERRGWIYYLRRKPGGTAAAGSLVALQQAIEPQVRHVLHVKDEKRQHAERDAPGADDPEPT